MCGLRGFSQVYKWAFALWFFSCFLIRSLRLRFRMAADDYEASAEHLRCMARALVVQEQGSKHWKYRLTCRMSMDQFCRLVDEAKLRKRSCHVGVWRCRATGRLGVAQITRSGRLRKRERYYYRDRASRAVRQRRAEERRAGTRMDWKVYKKLRAQWRREEKESWRERSMCQRVPEEDEAEDYLEVVAPVPLERSVK